MKVGVLALQGDVREHALALEAAGATPVAVKTQSELESVEGLILPGGESTTIGKLLYRFGLLDLLRARVSDGMPVFGTCAGLILMARDVVGDHDAPHRLGVLDVTVRRNAYGRQIDSFETPLSVVGLAEPVTGVFIRAPVVERVGDSVEVLARVRDDAVLVAQGRLIAATFHPEMSGDVRVHKMFLRAVREV